MCRSNARHCGLISRTSPLEVGESLVVCLNWIRTGSPTPWRGAAASWKRCHGRTVRLAGSRESSSHRHQPKLSVSHPARQRKRRQFRNINAYLARSMLSKGSSFFQSIETQWRPPELRQQSEPCSRTTNTILATTAQRFALTGLDPREITHRASRRH